MKRLSIWLFAGGLLVGVSSFVQSSGLGQSSGGAAHFRVGPVYTSDFPNLDIVVEASAGSTLDASISASDLILAEEGVRTSTALGLRKFSETGQGVAVLLAMDASGSMRGRPLDAVRKGLGQFVSKARDNDKVGVISFADDVRWEAEWSGTREETRRKLEGIRARGRYTVLWDAIDRALDELRSLDGPARRHLVVISDGHDEGSNKTLAQVIAKAASMRIPVDAIGMTRSNPRYLENLKELSAQSKGSYTMAPDLDALTRLVGNAVDSMLDSPVARFRVEKLKADGGSHRVGVYWKATGKEDETSTLLPSGGELPAPSPSSNPSGAPAVQKVFRPWYAAVAGGAVVLGIIAWLLFRRRRTAALPPPPLPEPIRPQLGRDAWRPSPSPISPAPAVLDSPPPQAEDSSAARFAAPLNPPPSRPGARTRFAAVFEPPALLIAKAGPFAGKTFRIDRTDFWVGAAENNHLRLDDETVSGNHAFFRFEADTLKVFDNHSTNDTWVNSQPVSGTACILSPGDEVQIGRSVFIVQRAPEARRENVAQPGPPFALS